MSDIDHWVLLHPNDYLRWQELRGKDVHLTIKDARVEELFNAKTNAKKKKGVVTFRETEKKLVLNRVNTLTIVSMHGEDPSAWSGRRVTLYPDPTVKVGRETKGGIRIRSKAPPVKGQRQQQPAPDADPDRTAARDED